MIQISGAGKRYGPKVLFQNADWLVTPKERTGLVGANGTGKSSLLKVLAGIEGLDSGSITVQRGVSIGYLPQEGLSLSGRSVFAECMTVFHELRALEEEQEQLAARMAELDPAGAEYAAVANRFHAAESEFRARDGYAIEAQVGMVLGGLGFGERDWKRRTEEFSGGWQMRIALAKLLLEKPNLLLLDEPTNHLDLEARNWLEDYLAAYPYAYVLVSHDRYFLDVTVRKIVELWNKNLHFYTGGYSRFEVLKDERRSQLLAAYANQQDRVQQLEAFINRFRAQATKAKQVQSRIKELEKIERIEIPPEEKTIRFSFPQPKPSGRIVAEFKKVSKAYGDHVVFSDGDLIIERGDRVSLVGVNGAGKSTMIKILAGAEPVTSGEYILGHNAQPDYFAQDQYKELDANAKLIDDLATVAPLAQRYIEQAGVAPRVHTRVGDLRTVHLGEGYDLVLVSAVCHMLDEKENARLIGRCHDALEPGGRLVIQDFLLDPDKCGPQSAALFSLNMLVGTGAGASYSEPEYAEWMRAAGFTGIRRVRLPGPAGLMIGTRGAGAGPATAVSER